MQDEIYLYLIVICISFWGRFSSSPIYRSAQVGVSVWYDMYPLDMYTQYLTWECVLMFCADILTLVVGPQFHATSKQASKQNDLLHWITFDRHHLMSWKCYRWWGLCWEPTWWHGCQVLKCWLWYSTCMYHSPPPFMVSPSNFYRESLQGPLGQYLGYLETRVNRSIGPIWVWIWIKDHNIWEKCPRG